MKGFLGEFRAFMDRGNVMDMAVGVIIGGALTGLVTALIKYVVTPVIAAATGGVGGETGWSVTIPGSDQVVDFGAFLSAVIDFVLVAFVVFLLVRSYNRARDLASRAGRRLSGASGEDGEPAARTCPYCRQEVPGDATRCPHCTSVLPNATAAEAEAMTGAVRPASPRAEACD